MDNGTKTPVSGTSPPTPHAQLPSSTPQQAAQPNQPPGIGIRLPQSSILGPASSGMSAVHGGAPQYIGNAAPDSPRSRLCAAARNGDCNAVKSMILAGNGNLNTIDPATGLTALMLATQHGHPDVVFLLCNGASANAIHHPNDIALDSIVATAGSNHMTSATTAGTTTASSTASASPASSSSSSSAASPDVSPEGIAAQPTPTTLLQAVEHNDAEALRRVLLELRQSGKDVAQEVSRVGKLKKSNDLLGEDLEVTPLMAAAYFGFEHPLGLLIDAGARVDQAQPDGMTALMLAAHKGSTATAEVLLRAGATVDLADFTGTTALMWASCNGDTATAQALLQAGARVDLAGTETMGLGTGRTALMWAAHFGNTATAKALLRAGAKVDLADLSGMTAMMVAAIRGHVDIVRALMNAGADPNLQNRNGHTALQLATHSGVIWLLRPER